MEETLIEGLLMMIDKDPFEEYLKESEPDKFNKSYAWSTAIGLQAVDRLKPSEYLELFLRKLLLNEKNELHNRNLHIRYIYKSEKADIETQKVDIKNEKVAIEEQKVDIESLLSKKEMGFSDKTIRHIQKMFDEFGLEEFFGRSAVADLLGLQNSSVSKLLSKLLGAGIIEPVSGHGKGKYRFSTTII